MTPETNHDTGCAIATLIAIVVAAAWIMRAMT